MFENSNSIQFPELALSGPKLVVRLKACGRGTVASPRLVGKLARTAGDKKLSWWFDSFYFKKMAVLCCRKMNLRNAEVVCLLAVPRCLGTTCLFILRLTRVDIVLVLHSYLLSSPGVIQC